MACACCEHSDQDQDRNNNEPGGSADYGRTLSFWAGAAVFALALSPALGGKAQIAAFAASVALLGGDVFFHAVKNLLRGRVLDENFLMSAAVIGAFSMGDHAEAAAVMIFYRIGEYAESRAVGRSRREIKELLDLKAEFANVKAGGAFVRKSPEELEIDDIILIKAGEKIPADCVALSGRGAVDTSALTGESAPRAVSEGDALLSGCVCLDAPITARVSARYENGAAARILELIENAEKNKSKAERFITRFSRVYTPVVVGCAVFLALLPPLFWGEPSEWLRRALIFLVVSCPCALVLSVPLAFFAGVGALSKMGVLVKGGGYIQQMARLNAVVFDKTGTLTSGGFEIKEIAAAPGANAREIMEIAGTLEKHSAHAIARSVTEGCASRGIDISRDAGDLREIAGFGITGTVSGELVCSGSLSLMEEYGLRGQAEALLGGSRDLSTVAHVARAGRYLGFISLRDRLKEDAATAIARIKELGRPRIVVLSGDRQESVADAARAAGADSFFAELLPGDKVERLLGIKKDGATAFVGDGINDAPALSAADVGLAMGALGSAAAVESADVVIMDDDIGKIARAMAFSRRVMSVVRQNIALAVVVKLAALLLSAAGLASMWLAIFADVGVCALTTLNSGRLIKIRRL
ncbi:MAG: heavy metal translocating P-type ATPase [Clostridiales bacterium]|nr:heavy metal translocating P-type ATPase [Clostridiales bacterium]